MKRRRALAALAFVPLVAAGCAAPQSAALIHRTGSGSGRARGLRPDDDTSLPAAAQLHDVPFFAQRDYECGPAALAMAMRSAGVAIEPETLVPEVWLPDRQGALQAEMLAAPPRRGLLATRLRGRLDGPLAAVAGGMPAIVFQNLGLPVAPVWHYAVLIGYDLGGETVVLHTGVHATSIQSIHAFERTWVRGGAWAMAVTPAERLPDGAAEDALVRAAAALERSAPAEALRSWEAIVARFPMNRTALLARGNAAWTVGERARALAAWRQAVERDPNFADAWNNLAHGLAQAGDPAAARDAARRAVALGGARRAIYEETLGRLVIPSGRSPKLPMP